MTWSLSPSRPPAIGRGGMVATSQPLAALTGAEALRDGGNAMDAALAAAGVLAVTEPNQCGVGGDLFAIVVRDGEPPVGLNASGRSPAEPGDALPELFGPRSVTVPGCPSGWTDLAERFSPLGLAAALAPGDRARPARLRRCSRPSTRAGGRRTGPSCRARPREVFRPRRYFANPALADTLEHDRRRRLLRGRHRGRRSPAPAGSLAGDLAAHRNDWVEPLRVRLSRPHAAGAAAERPGLDRGLGARVAGARPSRPTRWRRWPPPTSAATPPSAAPRTSARPTATAWRVSLIQSIFYGFGSQVIVPGLGFMLQNRGSGFVAGARPPQRVRPGKRPFHTIIPAALLDADGRWAAVFGVTGGQFQPQGHVQVLVNLLDHGMRPAGRARRAPLPAGGGRHGLARAAAGRPGRPLRPAGQPWSADGQLRQRPRHPRDADGLLRGGSEPRRDGLAIGV